MKKITKQKWLNALRSDRFTQGTGCLRDDKSYGSSSYCCLGVLCHVTGQERNQAMHRGYPNDTDDETVRPFQGLKPRTIRALVKMNDDKGMNFRQIAKWIEKNVREE
jgi:hypothetical protein